MILRPSSAYRRAQCPSSYYLEQWMPDTDNAASQEGREAHEVAARVLNSATQISEVSKSEMMTAITSYKDEIDKIRHRIDCDIFVEYKVRMPQIHTLCEGTVDCFLVAKDKSEIHIFDLKYGMRFVDAYENYQMLEYYAGVAREFNPNPETLVALHIVQPRINNLHEWYLTHEMFTTDYLPYLQMLEDNATNQHMQFKDGPACQYCKAFSICPVQRAKAQAPTRFEDTDSVLSELLAKQKHLNKYIFALETKTLRELQGGRQSEIFEIGQTPEREVFDEHRMDSRWRVLLSKLGPNLITPKQARERGYTEIEPFIKIIPGVPKLRTQK